MVSKGKMIEFLQSEFPKAPFAIEDFTDNSVVVRHQVTEQDLRPGGTVSGPTMMALADTALYVALLRQIGLVSLAVTTNLNFNFLRKPVADPDLLAEPTRYHRNAEARRLDSVFEYHCKRHRHCSTDAR